MTRRVRRLIDLAYSGNVRIASLTTGLPYATLRDLYTGRTTNPGIETLQILAARHGFQETWFLQEDQGEELLLGGFGVWLPAPLKTPDRPRPYWSGFIPYAAWPLVSVYRDLQAYLRTLPASPDRPIIGQATDEDQQLERLSAFLFAPVLAAEAAGEEVMHTGSWDNEKWLKTCRDLGVLWEQLLPDLLKKAHAYAAKLGPAQVRWMGYNPDREPPPDASQ